MVTKHEFDFDQLAHEFGLPLLMTCCVIEYNWLGWSLHLQLAVLDQFVSLTFDSGYRV
mgnify:CR=1 FL=1